MITQFLAFLSQFTLHLISVLGYPGIFLVMALENIFPPIPSEVVMPFAGFLVSQGRFSLGITIVLGSLGALVGALPYFFLGKILGGERFRRLLAVYGRYALVGEADLDRAEKWFNRYQGKAVLIGRVVPLARTLISVPAGFISMSLTKFLVYTLAGTFVWTSFLTLVGFYLGENWERIGPYLQKIDYLFAGLFAALFVFYFAYQSLNSKSQTSGKGTSGSTKSF